MTVLVTYATRYGVTRQVAGRIAAVLTVAGQEVRVVPIGADVDVSRHEAVVLGAPYHADALLPQARAFVRRHRHDLSDRHLWLFCCGFGRHDRAAPRELDEVAADLGAVDARAFRTLVCRSTLTVPDRVRWRLSTHQPAPSSDEVDWAEVEAWARGIAVRVGALEVPRPAVG